MKKVYLNIVFLVVAVAIVFTIYYYEDINSPLNGLDKKTWILYSIDYSDGIKITPTQESDFKLSLKNDWTFESTTDCNSIGGEYAVEGNLITFKNIFSTKMYCYGSKESDFISALEQAGNYFFTNKGDLVIELRSDSGSMSFK